MKNLSTIIILICLVISNTSCKETKEVINTVNNISLDGTYSITTINGEENTLEGLSLSFNEASNTISGNSGCNEFSGNYTLDEMALSIGMVTATMAYCDESVMNVERSFMKTLGNSGSYSIKGDVLTLFSNTNRTPVLTAKRVN